MIFEPMDSMRGEELLRQQERQFVQETMVEVAGFMLQHFKVEADVLRATGRVVALEGQIPSEENERSLTVTIGFDDTEASLEKLAEKTPLLCRFRITEQEESTYPSLSLAQRAGVLEILEDREEVDSALMTALRDPSRVGELNDLSYASESVVQYICDLDEGTIHKEVGTNFYLDGDLIAAIGVDAEVDLHVDTSVDVDEEQLFASLGDEMALIQRKDLVVMREVLHFLRLPGGELPADDAA